MYAQFFGLKQEPFSIAPDPRYLFMSARHREALAHLLYGLNSGGGFVLLTGEIGAGKTTVCRCFLEHIPKRCNVAYIFNPKLTVLELLKSVCDEFGITYAPHDPAAGMTVKDYIDPLNEFLLKTHSVRQSSVLIIDEAQNLSADVLEQLRLLTNLETNERKLLQVILIGQPELRTMLARPELEQLAQRVIARYHLKALSEPETLQYVRHRLAVAGMPAATLPFDRKALHRIHRLTGGVPRRINLLCDRSLLGAFATGKAQVDRHIVDTAAKEVFDRHPPKSDTPMQRPLRYALAGGLALAGGAAVFAAVTFGLGNRGQPQDGTVATKPSASAPAGSAAKSSGASVGAAVAAAPASAVAAASAAPDVRGNQRLLMRSEREALRELSAVWDLPTEGSASPCDTMPRHQVQCFGTNTNFALIRRLDRPGVLTLYDEQDRVSYALLVGVSDQTATLRRGDTLHTVSLDSLASMWRGDFATFWRVPPGYSGWASGEASGPLAHWVSLRLDMLDAEALPASQPTRGAELKSQIAAFQSAQGIKPDGLAGPLTLMLLNQATGVAEPRLLQSER